MRLTFCAACGSTDALEHHHLTPRAKGGGDEEQNLITLCGPCHGKTHGMKRQNISELTREGLKAAKARGVKLGSPVAADTVAAARASKSAKAKAKAQNLVAIVRDIERSGISTLSGIARALEARGVQTPSGNQNWQAAQVARVRAMAA